MIMMFRPRGGATTAARPAEGAPESEWRGEGRGGQKGHAQTLLLESSRLGGERLVVARSTIEQSHGSE